MRRFTHFAALDWSGARGLRQRGIALAVASGADAPALVRPGHVWSRTEILAWLEAIAAAGENMLIGFDFSAAFAFADCGAYFPEWAESPANAADLWALVQRLSGSDPNYESGGFLAHSEARRHFRHGRGNVGDLFTPGTGRLRIVEQHQRATKQAASVSNFNLVGAAQVGKASLSGMRVLHHLSGRIPLWPRDPVPAKGPLLVEIYTSLAARAAGMRARDAARSATAAPSIPRLRRWVRRPPESPARSATTQATPCWPQPGCARSPERPRPGRRRR
jgi:hypothetical protein